MARDASPDASADSYELTLLRALANSVPNVDSAVAEIARLSAILTLPKGTVHVISDIHGEDKKLRHVINNASGTLRPLIERLFGEKMEPKQFQEFLTLIFYPAEVTEQLEKTLTDPRELRAYAVWTLRHQFDLVRTLAARYSLKRAMEVFPIEYKELISEMLHEPTTDRRKEFVEAICDELQRRGKVLHLIHYMGRLVRNLAIFELIIGGDCWDRGPRGDRVVDYLRQQPNVSVIWGNHDASWLGAGLGHEALICNVLRISLRYRRLAQIDQGYSIPLTPLEYLANTIYADDPATHFMPKERGMRPMALVARMQKAAAVMQFKLEGQMIERNPQWQMGHRRLLHRINFEKGTIEIDGREYALRDTHLPTVDPKDPYTLTAEERACMDRLKDAFVNSQKLWEHLKFVVGHGSMYLDRDDHLIFHGCVPCDEFGGFLPLTVDDAPVAGRAMFDAIERVVLRATEKRDEKDLDFLWYLWSGPRSPLFGKDRIATFERDFIEDKHPHEEKKDPYFALIHEREFCEKVLREFGVDPQRGLIVNGHVPVKIEKGESPLKRSGKAITIDGAFSDAYGDHGYTLVLEADRTLLAKHHHFESVDAAIRQGVDIVPSVTIIREWTPPRRVADTERGKEMRYTIRMLERLIDAYRCNRLRQKPAGAV
jgi:fructose-1,6-bisphosphatase-3